MYELTKCPVCNTVVHAHGGCCGDPLHIVYNCPCAKDALDGTTKRDEKC